MYFLSVAQGVAWNQGRFVAWLQFTGLVWGIGVASGREFLQKECEGTVLFDGQLTTGYIRQLG